MRRSVLAVVAILVTLLFPSSEPRRFYGHCFRVLSRCALSLCLAEPCEVAPLDSGGSGEDDTSIVIHSGLGGRTWQIACNSYRLGFVPAVVFLWLCLMTPVPWRLRVRYLIVGTGVVHLYVLIRLALALLAALFALSTKLSVDPGLGILKDHRWSSLLCRLFNVLHGEPTVYVGVPVLVWLFLRSAWADQLTPNSVSDTSEHKHIPEPWSPEPGFMPSGPSSVSTEPRGRPDPYLLRYYRK